MAQQWCLGTTSCRHCDMHIALLDQASEIHWCGANHSAILLHVIVCTSIHVMVMRTLFVVVLESPGLIA